MEAGKAQKSAQSEAKGLYKWRDTVMVVEGFVSHPDKQWFKHALRNGAREAVAVDKVSVINFSSAREAMEFEEQVKKASETDRKLTLKPHPLASHYANSEILWKFCQDGHRNNQEVTKTIKNGSRMELKHTRYARNEF